MAPTKEVDVMIVGGGPTGLILAYSLLKFGLSVHLVGEYCVLSSNVRSNIDFREV